METRCIKSSRCRVRFRNCRYMPQLCSRASINDESYHGEIPKARFELWDCSESKRSLKRVKLNLNTSWVSLKSFGRSSFGGSVCTEYSLYFFCGETKDIPFVGSCVCSFWYLKEDSSPPSLQETRDLDWLKDASVLLVLPRVCNFRKSSQCEGHL